MVLLCIFINHIWCRAMASKAIGWRSEAAAERRVAAAERAVVAADVQRQEERAARLIAVTEALECAEAVRRPARCWAGGRKYVMEAASQVRTALGLKALAEQRRAAAEAALAAAGARVSGMEASLAAAEAGRSAAIKELREQVLPSPAPRTPQADGAAWRRQVTKEHQLKLGPNRARGLATAVVDSARTEARLEAAAALQKRCARPSLGQPAARCMSAVLCSSSGRLRPWRRAARRSGWQRRSYLRLSCGRQTRNTRLRWRSRRGWTARGRRWRRARRRRRCAPATTQQHVALCCPNRLRRLGRLL